jgi:hypothetical protein
MPTLTVICPECGKRSRLSLAKGETEAACLGCGELMDLEDVLKSEVPKPNEASVRSRKQIDDAEEVDDEDDDDLDDEPIRRRRGRPRRRSRRRKSSGSFPVANMVACFLLGIVALGAVGAIIIAVRGDSNKQANGNSDNPNLPRIEFRGDTLHTLPEELFRPIPDGKSDNGWAVYDVASEGFTMALPDEWRLVDLVNIEKKSTDILRQNPGLREMIAAFRNQYSAGIRFYALNENSMKTLGYSPTITVKRDTCPKDATLDTYVEEVLVGIKGQTGVEELTHERCKIAAGEAERFHWKTKQPNVFGSSQENSTTLCIYVSEGSVFVVTMGMLSNQESKFGATFDKIAKSLKITKKAPSNKWD